MPSPSPEYLIRLALDAAEEILAEAQFGPVRRTGAIRVVLAYLASQSVPPHHCGWVFKNFWRDLETEHDTSRWQSLNSDVNGLYRVVGIKREVERSSRIETRVRERRQAAGLPHVPVGYGGAFGS